MFTANSSRSRSASLFLLFTDTFGPRFLGTLAARGATVSVAALCPVADFVTPLFVRFEIRGIVVGGTVRINKHLGQPW
jgi:hypothetical protein